MNAKPLMLLRLALLLPMIAAPAHADSVIVVSDAGVPVTALSREDVADLFLGKRQITVEGLSLTPVDVDDDELRAAFYQGVADMSGIRVNAYWSRLVFSAQGRPPRKVALDVARSLIKSQPGVVTYLPDGDADGLRILLRLP